jgi:nucleoside-diphosphate-sugar epimerase
MGSGGLRVVVTGATGNVGTSVVSALSREPSVDSIIGLARRPTTWNCPKTTLVTADITADDLHEVVRGADVVVHLAWLFHPTHRQESTWDNNVLGAIRVFEAVAAEHVGALIHASSLAAYSPGPSDLRVSEDWPTHGWPGAAYPREKAYLERWLDACEMRTPDLRVVRMRPCFLFKRASATAQRRLFMGPLFPRRLLKPELVPVVPRVNGLVAQVLHTDDAAQAYVGAVLRPVRGAFNLASEPAVDGAFLASLLDARQIPLTSSLLRMAVAAAWHAHLIPASPGLLETVLQLPLLDASRAHDELDWAPAHSPRATLEEFLAGLREGAGMPTEPLASDSVRGRAHEWATGVGQRE